MRVLPKRVFALLLAAAIALAPGVSCLAAEEDAPAPDMTVSLISAGESAAVGSTARIGLSIETDNPLAAAFNTAELVLRYDAAALSFDAEASVLGEDAQIISEYDEAAGALRILRFGEDVPLTEPLSLAFTVLREGRTEVTLIYAALDRRVMADLRDAPQAGIDIDTAEIVGAAAENTGNGGSGRPASDSTLTEPTYPVTFSGSGIGDVVGESVTNAGKAYYFFLRPEDGYEYAITATVSGAPADVLRVGSYACRVADVTGPLAIVVEKLPSGAEAAGETVAAQAHIYEYLRLDGARRIYLITVEGDPGEGYAFTYDENEMLWSEDYGAYAWLTVSQEDIDGFGASVSALLGGAERSGAGKELPAPEAERIREMLHTSDVVLDDDAVRLYLAADVNGSHGLDILDAVAAIAARGEGER